MSCRLKKGRRTPRKRGLQKKNRKDKSCSIYPSFQTYSLSVCVALFICISLNFFVILLLLFLLSYPPLNSSLSHLFHFLFIWPFALFLKLSSPPSILLYHQRGRGSSREGGRLLLEIVLNNTFPLERSRGG